MVRKAPDTADREKGRYTLIRDPEDFQFGIYDKPLPCFGCGVGWFSFLLGFVFPLMWYYGTFLYFGNHCRKDPRERAGLAASAIALFIYFIVIAGNGMFCCDVGHSGVSTNQLRFLGGMYIKRMFQFTLLQEVTQEFVIGLDPDYTVKLWLAIRPDPSKKGHASLCGYCAMPTMCYVPCRVVYFSFFKLGLAWNMRCSHTCREPS
ncbi:hypothetical protein KPL70_001076 [Citrus sinensis]|nr:hypothetical protein KPL70_001076 [Citrus sinensis]